MTIRAARHGPLVLGAALVATAAAAAGLIAAFAAPGHAQAFARSQGFPR